MNAVLSSAARERIRLKKERAVRRRKAAEQKRKFRESMGTNVPFATTTAGHSTVTDCVQRGTKKRSKRLVLSDSEENTALVTSTPPTKARRRLRRRRTDDEDDEDCNKSSKQEPPNFTDDEPSNDSEDAASSTARACTFVEGECEDVNDDASRHAGVENIDWSVDSDEDLTLGGFIVPDD